MDGDELSEMGPIDYILVEWPGRQPNGEVAPHLIDLVDRGLIRVLDLVFVSRTEDGTISGVAIADVGGVVAELAIFEGASSGLLSQEDIDETGGVLEAGTALDEGGMARAAGGARSRGTSRRLGDRSAEGAGRAESAGSPHRGGVRNAEGEAALLLGLRLS